VALLAVAGSVHLELWRDGYRFIDDVGVLFLANVVVAGVLALAVLVRPVRLVLLAVAGFSAVSLVGLLLSRTSVGIAGYVETGWSTEATATLAAEVGAIVAAGVLFVQTHPTWAAARRRA
jgi:hypothetical protein